jgi:hypothetical protein
VFLRGNPKREKTAEFFFLYVFRITFTGSTKFLCFLAANGRRLQTPIFLGYNLKEDPTPQFSGYNQKESTTPYVLCL